MRFSQTTHLLIFFSLKTLTSIMRTGLPLPILVELINLVNSYNFSFSNYLTQMVNFRTQNSDWFSWSCSFGFISSDASVCSGMTFPPLGSSDHVVISVSIDFPSNSQWDDSFHCIAYDYSFHRRISLNLVLLLLLVSFVSGFRLELMYIYLIENIRSNLTFIHVVQLIVLLP